MKRPIIWIYNVISILAMAYGFPMAITNIGRDDSVAIACFIVAGVGLLMLIISALVILSTRKKGERKAEQEEDEFN